MKAWLWNEIFGMKTPIDEQKLVFLLKILKEEWDRSSNGTDVVAIPGAAIKRSASSHVLLTQQERSLSPDFKMFIDEDGDLTKTVIGRPQSKQLVPLVIGESKIDIVEVSQSKVSEERNRMNSLRTDIEKRDEKAPPDIYVEMLTTDEKIEKVENKKDANESQLTQEFKEQERSKGSKDSQDIAEKKNYKKKVNINIDKKPDFSPLNISYLEALPSKKNTDNFDTKRSDKIIEVEMLPTKNEKVEKLENLSNSMTLRGRNDSRCGGGEQVGECTCDKSSTKTVESSQTQCQPSTISQVEAMGLKARINELERMVDDLSQSQSGKNNRMSKSAQISPTDNSPKSSPRLRDLKTHKGSDANKSFLGFSFWKKKEDKKSLARSVSARIVVEKEETKKILTPQLTKRESSTELEQPTQSEFPSIGVEEYRQEVIRLNKQIVQMQRKMKQKDSELQALVDEQKNFFPMVNLKDVDYFNNKISTEFVETVLSCLSNKPIDVQQKYIGHLNDCVEVKLAVPDSVSTERKTKEFHYTSPSVRPKIQRVASTMCLTRSEVPVTQRDMYQCLCQTFQLQQEDYYHMFQVISYLYFAPFRQQSNVRIINKLDQTFPEMMMIERTLVRNLKKGFVDALSEYAMKLKLYIPFVLLKDKILFECSSEINTIEFKSTYNERMSEFKKKYGGTLTIPEFTVCVNRISSRITEMARFVQDIMRHIPMNDAEYTKVLDIVTITLQTDEELKDAIVEYLELEDVKNVEQKFLTTSTRICDGKRRVKYFGGMKLVTPGEVGKDWKMCLLFTDVMIVARPFVFGKKSTRDRENLLRFENSPRGRDVSELNEYRFNEEYRIPIRSPVNVMNIIDTDSVHNAFMFGCLGVRKNCMCVSTRERDNWVQAIVQINEDTQ
ncbi:hypothetical protein EIN_079780 [Entamoeba invadens IP1]|uniref:hypothetical protein n=1 Tax=Entamoeba invadens IP1 TaxID=370355 RepID=UPI0002C3EBF2|nr:hypothetical protein EIN_079780 [Entamoeba invadens IP1]ELP85036.1 hypothetical protein EIN_079780 [Entamoeba invadens IP1]|eukprot:XP_004184382.1 hypothetical protein EIN_079780 [Entamoeba invadens IP1]